MVAKEIKEEIKEWKRAKKKTGKADEEYSTGKADEEEYS